MSARLFRILLCLFLLPPYAFARADELPEPIKLSLNTAMTMAIRHNLDLRGDALNAAISAANLRQSRGLYDPVLSLAGDYQQTFYTGESYGTNDTTVALNLTQNLPTGGSLTASTLAGYTTPESDFPDDNWQDWYTSVGITLSQPLLKNAGKEATELSITLADNAHKGALERFRQVTANTVYAVVREYNRLYTLRQVRTSRLVALNSARQTLEKMKKNGARRELHEVEVANTEYSISQRLKDLVDAERRIKDQEARLRYVIGMESKIDLIPVDPPSREEPLENLEQAVALALGERPDLKQLQLEVQSNELRERVARRRRLPNLYVTAGGGLRGIDDDFNASVEQIQEGKGRWWTAGLHMSMPLGNRAATAEYQRSKEQTEQAEYRLAAQAWKLRDEIEADMRALISARVQIQVADRAVKISELRVEQYRKSVARRTSPVQDLLNAEHDLIFARDDQALALEGFANAVAQLWLDAGVLLERMHITIDPGQTVHMAADEEPVASAPHAAAMPGPAPDERRASAIKERPASQDRPAAAPAVFVLQIGEYIAAELATVTEKVIAAGLVPRVTPGAKQPRDVVRLVAGTFPDQRAAQEALGKLREKIGPEAFMLKNDAGAYVLYAGSYLSRAFAEEERKRLAAAGVSLTLVKASVQLPTSRLSAGPFGSRQEAQAGATKLQKLGVSSVVQKQPGNS